MTLLKTSPSWKKSIFLRTNFKPHNYNFYTLVSFYWIFPPKGKQSFFLITEHLDTVWYTIWVLLTGNFWQKKTCVWFSKLEVFKMVTLKKEKLNFVQTCPKLLLPLTVSYFGALRSQIQVTCVRPAAIC